MESVIKLKHADVMDQLNQITRTLEEVSLPTPAAKALGENDLRLSKEWLQREHEIHLMVEEYKKAVQKNVVDTKANINYLREQDESITFIQNGPFK